MNDAIIAGVFTLLGGVVTFMGSYILQRDARQNEQNRKKIKDYLKEIKAFYNLEQLYIKEVASLRQKLPDEEGSKAEGGIKNEFRRKNEENGNIVLTMTALEADKMLAEMD